MLYYGVSTPEYTHSLFEGLFERFLNSRPGIQLQKISPIDCPNCRERQERAVVTRRRNQGQDSVFCSNCGENISLPEIDGSGALSQEDREKVEFEQEVARRRTVFETELVRVKAILRDQKDATPPNCFISYSWGVTEQETWVEQLAEDLTHAGINVALDRWHNPPGTSITKFVERISDSDFVLPVGTLTYLEKYNTTSADPVVSVELELINALLSEREAEREKVIPLLLEGEQRTAFPPLFRNRVYIDFRSEEYYFIRLFDLILTLYDIPFDHQAIREIRRKMQSEFELRQDD